MATRKKLVAGNWKMNGSLSGNASLIDEILKGFSGVSCDVLICPPFPYLAQVAQLLAGSAIRLGAQNLSAAGCGARTGEVAGEMLRDLGCTHVLVGHSERRALYGETDEVVAEKFERALKSSLIPVLCVGETLAERQAGLTESVVFRQIDAVIARCGAGVLVNAVLAYEPVWAIGTGVTASPAQAQAVHAAIRARVSAVSPSVAEAVCMVYGGSVKPDNALDLFGQPDIDGGLIGGASLVAGDFLAICQAAV